MSGGAARRADRALGLCRDLHNAAIEARRTAWQRARKTVSFYDQCRELTDLRASFPEYAALDRHMLEGVLRRVDLAFAAFFRRIKEGGPAGYPRFRGRDRFDSVTYRQRGWKLDGRHLTLRCVGRIKLHLSRPIEGTIKTVTLKRDAVGDWFAVFSCDGVPECVLPETGRAVGVDLGLTSFIATSDGQTIQHPRAFRVGEQRLSRAQRKRSKMQRGGGRYRKHSRAIASLQRRSARIRRDHHFKTALDLVRRYDVVVVEDLNVAGLARSALAKAIADAGWGQFLSILASKAEEAGRQVIAVDPRGTSQVCSGCGCVPERRKTLRDRIHSCPDCGLTIDRDVNAARVILKRAGAPPTASGPATKVAA